MAYKQHYGKKTEGKSKNVIVKEEEERFYELIRD